MNDERFKTGSKNFMNPGALTPCPVKGCTVHSNHTHSEGLWWRPSRDASIGCKDDKDKLNYALIPSNAEELIVKVLMHGAKKYGEENWRNVQDPIKRYCNAMRRHLAAIRKGEYIDPDSGLPHLAHIACSAIFLLELDSPNKDLSK